MKPSKRNLANAEAKAEKLARGPKPSKYAAKVAAERATIAAQDKAAEAVVKGWR